MNYLRLIDNSELVFKYLASNFHSGVLLSNCKNTNRILFMESTIHFTDNWVGVEFITRSYGAMARTYHNQRVYYMSSHKKFWISISKINGNVEFGNSLSCQI